MLTSLTSLTTIGGLLPLSLFGGALWAPMTNGMIFGLAVSTVLTLFVVPTVYVLFVENFNMRVASGGRAGELSTSDSGHWLTAVNRTGTCVYIN